MDLVLWISPPFPFAPTLPSAVVGVRLIPEDRWPLDVEARFPVAAWAPGLPSCSLIGGGAWALVLLLTPSADLSPLVVEAWPPVAAWAPGFPLQSLSLLFGGGVLALALLPEAAPDLSPLAVEAWFPEEARAPGCSSSEIVVGV